jgi:hypothetical protein
MLCTYIIYMQDILHILYYIYYIIYMEYVLYNIYIYVLEQGSATYCTRANSGTRNDFQWHAE